MGFLRGSPPVCPADQRCSQVARIYMKFCLCSVRDGASLTLGMISILSWAVAEVPQIITTLQEKSSDGLSLAFLATWILGDFFNVLGCLLEPATLPTQFYMALFYTATTLILTGQTVYYRYIYHREKMLEPKQDHSFQYEIETECKVKNDKPCVSSIVKEENSLQSSPIPVKSTHMSGGRDYFIRSARSLSKSHTPPSRSYILQPCDSEKPQYPSLPEQDSIEEPLLEKVDSINNDPPSKNLFCVVTGLALFLLNFKCYLEKNTYGDVSGKTGKGIVLSIGRKILQVNVASVDQDVSTNNSIGSYFGWAMAIIYMGGRLPQICLNIKRGHVKGLNPFMFLFALIGNLTYVASILVKSLEWAMIQPNLPWLVDAGGCVILDTFILVQFIYFRNQKQKDKLVPKCDSKLTKPAY